MPSGSKPGDEEYAFSGFWLTLPVGSPIPGGTWAMGASGAGRPRRSVRSPHEPLCLKHRRALRFDVLGSRWGRRGSPRISLGGHHPSPLSEHDPPFEAIEGPGRALFRRHGAAHLASSADRAEQSRAGQGRVG